MSLLYRTISRDRETSWCDLERSSDHSKGHAASDLLFCHLRASMFWECSGVRATSLVRTPPTPTMAMVKRNMVTNDVPRSRLLSIRCVSLSIFIASVSLLLAFISAPLPGKLSDESLDRPQQNVELQSRLAPGSYRNDIRMKFDNISPPARRKAARSTGNTVAVVLNWSRFENVRRIASVLCKPELDPIIEHVLVWNNNPKPLTYLVRHMVASSWLFYFIDLNARIFCRPRVRKKNCGSSTLPRTCTSMHDSWVVPSRFPNTASSK